MIACIMALKEFEFFPPLDNFVLFTYTENKCLNITFWLERQYQNSCLNRKTKKQICMKK